MTVTYEYWPPNTSFQLCNVPWDSSYRDIVKFDSTSARDAYFASLDSQSMTITKATMARYGIPVLLEIPFNEAQQWNYIVVNNDYSFDSPRKWYYFVQSVNYVNARVSQFNIMLDVWTTFQFDVKLGNCFVERGHIGVANENQMNDYGRDYLDILEGLDTGSQGMIVSDEVQGIYPKSSQTDPGHIDFNDYGIIVMSSTDLSADPGTVDNPKLKTAQGSYPSWIISGACTYYFDRGLDFITVIGAGSEHPWVTEGIQAIWMVPRSDSYKDGSQPCQLFGDSKYGVTFWNLTGSGDFEKTFMSVANFRDRFRDSLPDNCKKFQKFLTYPYSWIELTMQNGTSIVLKPQYIDDTGIVVMEYCWVGAPNPRAAFFVKNYGGHGSGHEDLNVALNWTDWPRLSIVNNAGIAYLASNAHSIAYAYKSADWAQQKTMMGVNNAYAQASASTGYAAQQTALSNRNRSALNDVTSQQLTVQNGIAQKQQNTDYLIKQVNGVTSSVLGMAGGVASGNAVAAGGALISGAVGLVTNDIANSQQTATRNATLANNLSTNAARTAQTNSYSTSSTNLSNQQTMQFADMNRELSTAVASGDYANTVAGIDAKVQDAALNEPTVSGASGGDAFLTAIGKLDVHIRFKRLPMAALMNIASFWARYGYYVQRFITPPTSLMCMSKFTYWKMHELYVRSAKCPEEFRLTIKGIFEKGVTVWKSPGDIGNVDYFDNEPLSGISY